MSLHYFDGVIQRLEYECRFQRLYSVEGKHATRERGDARVVLLSGWHSPGRPMYRFSRIDKDGLIWNSARYREI